MKETSFGIIPLQKRDNIWHVLLIQHQEGHFWSFPKGHGEKNEELPDLICPHSQEGKNHDLIFLTSQQSFFSNLLGSVNAALLHRSHRSTSAFSSEGGKAGGL